MYSFAASPYRCSHIIQHPHHQRLLPHIVAFISNHFNILDAIFSVEIETATTSTAATHTRNDRAVEWVNSLDRNKFESPAKCGIEMTQCNSLTRMDGVRGLECESGRATKT